MKSRLAIVQDYIKQEVHDIFKDTRWDSIKDNLYFEDEFNEEEEPDNKLLWIYCVITEATSSYQMEDKYIYDVSFVFIYNKTYGHRDLAEIEQYFDGEFQRRIVHQNDYGLWFYNLIKGGVTKEDGGVDTKTVLSVPYTMRVYFK